MLEMVISSNKLFMGKFSEISKNNRNFDMFNGKSIEVDEI